MILLQKQVEDVNNDEVEVDIDELLDMDSDEERRRHLQVNNLENMNGKCALFEGDV